MALKKAKNSLQILQIAKINLRHNFIPLLLLSAVIMILTPVLFGTTNLDSVAAAVPLEMLISIMGIILLTPIFQPEQNDEIKDIISSKYVDCIYVYLIRVAYSVTGLALLILLFCAYMSVCGCQISFALIFGTLADTMFLGSVGMFSAAIANNLPVSFMIPILYYGFNLFQGKKLGVFNLFSMMSGDYTPNKVLFLISLLLITASLFLKRAIIKHQ